MFLYELCHGHAPFRAKNDLDKVKLIKEGLFEFRNGCSKFYMDLVQ